MVDMGASGKRNELRSGNLIMNFMTQLQRREQIILSDGDQCGDVDGVESTYRVVRDTCITLR